MFIRLLCSKHYVYNNGSPSSILTDLLARRKDTFTFDTCIYFAS